MSSSLEATTASTQPNKSSTPQEEMRKVRQRQQQIADEHAKEAAIKRKEKEAKEKERKNQAALRHYPGDRLGNGTRPSSSTTTTTTSNSRLRTNDFNPMQPGNSGTSSYRYVACIVLEHRHFCFLVVLSASNGIEIVDASKVSPLTNCNSFIFSLSPLPISLL